MSDLKKIGITGGKGGTGKSTVAVLLAQYFADKGKKVILADCDVECPNDYLLLGAELTNEEQKIWGEVPEINEEGCIKCGRCVEVCEENAIFQPPGEVPEINYDLCTGCGACWQVCPENVITPKKQEEGKIFLNEINNNFSLITGKAATGVEETGPIVDETKEFSINYAHETDADLVLVDTAAGTHCPVINALYDLDFAYVVTEPTPMGVYDLRLILKLCEKLDLPVKVILNQFDLGDEELIKEVLKTKDIAIEAKIPYSKLLEEKYSRGELLNLKLDKLELY